MNARKRIRVCHTLNTYEIGGAETVALDLARSHDPDLFEVEVIAFIDGSGTGTSPMRARFHEAGVKTFSINQPHYRSPAALWRIARLLHSRRYDVIHGHNRGSDYWGMKIGSLVGVPHGFWTRHLVYNDMSSKQIRRYRGMAKKAECVIAVSESVRRSCIETEGIAPDKVLTIVNGIDTEKFKPISGTARSSVRLELGVENDETLLLFVGRFNHQKAPDLFIKAVSDLHHRGEKVRGFLCGYGPLEPTLHNLVADSGGAVQILGMRTDIPQLLGACDLFISTSRNEGLPLNLMEAMCAGCGFLAPDIPQVRELTQGQEEMSTRLLPAPKPELDITADLVSAWSNGIQPHLNDSKGNTCCGLEGRKRIESSFSLQSMVRRYEQLYIHACDA